MASMCGMASQANTLSLPSNELSFPLPTPASYKAWLESKKPYCQYHEDVAFAEILTALEANLADHQSISQDTPEEKGDMLPRAHALKRKKRTKIGMPGKCSGGVSLHMQKMLDPYINLITQSLLLDMSIKKIAKYLQVNRTTLSRFISYKKELFAKEKESLCKELNIEPRTTKSPKKLRK